MEEIHTGVAVLIKVLLWAAAEKHRRRRKVVSLDKWKVLEAQGILRHNWKQGSWRIGERKFGS